MLDERSPIPDPRVEDVPVPARGFDQPGEHPHGRGFAGAIRAEEPEGAPGADLERGEFHCDRRAVLLQEIAGRDPGASRRNADR